MPVVSAKEITKSFGTIKAVNGITFDLNQGEILGLLGPNGAGKTTTIRMILDIFKPDKGSLTVFGGAMDEPKKNMVGYLPEERGLYQDITLEKCLHYLASIKGLPDEVIEDRLTEYIARFELKEYRKKKVKELSKGMQQKAQLISTFIHQPKLVIVDEPFSSLDPINTQMVKELLREEKSKGTAIMMSTHQMNQAEELCDRLLLIDKGKIVLEGRLDHIRKQFAKPEVLVKSNSPIPDGINGIESIRQENNHQRIFLKKDAAPKRILAELVRLGVELEQFEIAAPTLDEIFISVVTNHGLNA